MELFRYGEYDFPYFSDTAELTVPYIDPILHQVTQPVPQTGGAVGGIIPQTGGAVVQQIPQTVVQPISQTGGAVGGIVGMATGGAIPRPGNPLYHQYQHPPPHHQIPIKKQRTSPINYLQEVDHPERILSSTPTGQAPPISAIPPLIPH